MMVVQDLIKALEEKDQRLVLSQGFSYYHLYVDNESLALEPAENVSVKEMLDSLTEVLGEWLVGQDGEEYKITPCTEVYLAEWQSVGKLFTLELLEG
jgi:hypothetical protein